MSDSSRNQQDACGHKAGFGKPGRLSVQGDTSRSGDAQRHQLLTDLEDIGRNERSITPTALGAHHMLLNCPQVLSRVGGNPTDAQLQKAAHAALKNAIATLPTRSDRLIAQAILGATKDFEGKIVDERKQFLEDNYSITKSTYKRRRLKVLTFLVDYLMSDDADVSLQGGDLAAYTSSLHNLGCLLQDVAQLSYIFSAYEFIKAFDKQLYASPKSPQPSRRHNCVLTDSLYEAYLELILSAGYCLHEAPYSCRAQLLTHIPVAFLSETEGRLEQIFDFMPFHSDNINLICQNRYSRIKDLLVYRRTQQAFKSLWKPWARAKLTFDSSTDISDEIVDIQFHCYKLLDLALESLNYHFSDGEYVDNIIGIVADYYGLEPSSQILDGQSLSDHCLPYLQKQSPLRFYFRISMVP
jgi:hypothetical protein